MRDQGLVDAADAVIKKLCHPAVHRGITAVRLVVPMNRTFILWLLYIAYLMLRSYVINPGRVETLSAVVGVLGFVDAIIDYMAIRWWRTQHPQPVIGGGAGSGLEPRMWLTVFVAWGAFLCLFSYLVRQRMALARLGRELAELRRDVLSQVEIQQGQA